MGQFLFLIVVGVLALSRPAYCQKVQDQYKNIPESFLRFMERGQSLDAFRGNIFTPLSAYYNQDIWLDESKLSALVNKAAEPIVKEMDKTFSDYDENKDGHVTYDEVYSYHRLYDKKTNTLSNEYKYLYDIAQNYFKLDTNKDQIVSRAEAVTLNRDVLRGRALYIYESQIEVLYTLLALDPNHDKSLRPTEVEEIVRKVFGYMDVNDNHFIDSNEISDYRLWTKSRSGEQSFSKKDCSLFKGLTFPRNIDVYAALGVRGVPTDIQFIGEDSKVGRFKVVVNNPERPVALILSAVDPSIWEIATSKDTVIHTIIVQGDTLQVVDGSIQKAQLIYTGRNKEQPACNIGNVSAGIASDLRYVNGVAQSIFRKSIKNVIPLDRKQAYTATFGNADTQNRYVSDLQGIEYLAQPKTTPFVGTAGLDYALEKGYLRRISEEEVSMWNYARVKYEHPNVIIKQVSDLDQIPFTRVKGGYYAINVDDYVVPLGVDVRLFVPKGIRPPFQNLSKAAIYDMNTLKCFGNKHLCRPDKVNHYEHKSVTYADFQILAKDILGWEKGMTMLALKLAPDKMQEYRILAEKAKGRMISLHLADVVRRPVHLPEITENNVIIVHDGFFPSDCSVLRFLPKSLEVSLDLKKYTPVFEPKSELAKKYGKSLGEQFAPPKRYGQITLEQQAQLAKQYGDWSSSHEFYGNLDPMRDDIERYAHNGCANDGMAYKDLSAPDPVEYVDEEDYQGIMDQAIKAGGIKKAQSFSKIYDIAHKGYAPAQLLLADSYRQAYADNAGKLYVEQNYINAYYWYGNIARNPNALPEIKQKAKLALRDVEEELSRINRLSDAQWRLKNQ